MQTAGTKTDSKILQYSFSFSETRQKPGTVNQMDMIVWAIRNQQLNLDKLKNHRTAKHIYTCSKVIQL